jgi:hypothetical protein
MRNFTAAIYPTGDRLLPYLAAITRDDGKSISSGFPTERTAEEYVKAVLQWLQLNAAKNG